MKIDQLPIDGTRIWFRSDHPSRQPLNNSFCTILSRKKLNLASGAYAFYTSHMAVEIQFPYQFEDSRHNGNITWADLNEIHLIHAHNPIITI